MLPAIEIFLSENEITNDLLKVVLANLVIPIQAVPMCFELLQAMLAHLVNSEKISYRLVNLRNTLTGPLHNASLFFPLSDNVRGPDSHSCRA